jgi:NAD(P)-dependent dehydrogenase (short-subunit alcohol dehydrogenase family)
VDLAGKTAIVTGAGFVRADVRVGDDIQHMVEVAERAYDGLDILVNNTGGGGHVELHFPRRARCGGAPRWT